MFQPTVTRKRVARRRAVVRVRVSSRPVGSLLISPSSSSTLRFFRGPQDGRPREAMSVQVGSLSPCSVRVFLHDDDVSFQRTKAAEIGVRCEQVRILSPAPAPYLSFRRRCVIMRASGDVLVSF